MKLPDSIRVERRGFQKLYLSEGVTAEEVLTALSAPGEMLKHGNKRNVRRVGDWVIKSALFNAGVGLLKLSVYRKRYRNGWRASIELTRRGISVPRTIAFVEQRFMGVIWGNSLIYEYMKDCIPTHIFAQSLKARGGEAKIDAYFQGLSDALGKLAEANVFHRDLKPDNILTLDLNTFYFIDLDEILLDEPFRVEHRLRNHTQLANGFQHDWEKVRIDDFLRKTIPEGEDHDKWLAQVWDGVDK